MFKFVRKKHSKRDEKCMCQELSVNILQTDMWKDRYINHLTMWKYSFQKKSCNEGVNSYKRPGMHVPARVTG